MIKLTYVTITYQAVKVLQRTLDSVLHQDYPEITHLIIENMTFLVNKISNGFNIHRLF